MMHRCIRHVFSLLLFSFLTSCVKEIPLIQDQFSEDLVVNGLIQANEPISISVIRQIPVSSMGNNPVDSTLTIILSRNDEIIDTMLFIDGRYYSGYRAYPGNQYSITIKFSENDSMYAETRVPDNALLPECKFTTGRIFDEYGESLTECFISFKDDPKRNDYYLLYTGRFFRDTFDLNNYWSYWHLNDPLLVNEGILDYNPSYFVFSDELLQGLAYTLNLNLKYGSTVEYCVFQTISSEYYLFIKSLIRHQYNQQYVDHSRLDPIELLLKGQPSEVYSNVQNGKGIFASYSEVIKEFKNMPTE
ncbi:MAG: DUF4249 domain-containing protein [Bacteroidota bacterium]